MGTAKHFHVPRSNQLIVRSTMTVTSIAGQHRVPGSGQGLARRLAMWTAQRLHLSLIHISEPTRQAAINAL